jgi:hypothetical protein
MDDILRETYIPEEPDSHDPYADTKRWLEEGRDGRKPFNKGIPPRIF